MQLRTVTGLKRNICASICTSHRSAAGGRWRRKRAPRGLEKDVELWPAKGLRTSRRVHDKSLKRRSPEWRRAAVNKRATKLWITAAVNERGLHSPPCRGLCFPSACDRAPDDGGWFTFHSVKHALAIIYPNAYYRPRLWCFNKTALIFKIFIFMKASKNGSVWKTFSDEHKKNLFSSSSFAQSRYNYSRKITENNGFYL